GTGAVAKAITLGWTNADDRITASSYEGTLTLADAFIDEDGTLHTSSNVGTRPTSRFRRYANIRSGLQG
ncbi:MAG: hypothetical protein IIZ92_07380, partial [Aquincola sp.]|nr:hypothetical protein [Aquincola sp.]